MNKAKSRMERDVLLANSERCKRLGQYFTGVPLGRLLASLAKAEKATSIIDPMAGSGDLLEACIHIGATPDTLGAVEIEKNAFSTCVERLPQVVSICGSAFDPDVLTQLPLLQWDLVIANPPYVRYQSLAKNNGNKFQLPTAIEIRNGLISTFDTLPSLDKIDKELFKKLAASYSGLADLAVPSLILSAALVRPDGRLALVLPEAWLNRDYAAVVQYLLLRWFKIEFVVEDEHATWFTDAQVKTTLLIARRITRMNSAFVHNPDETFLRLRLSGQAKGIGSVVGHLYPDTCDKEKCFAEQARSWLASGINHKGSLVEAYHVPFIQIASSLLGTCSNQSWLSHMQDTNASSAVSTPSVPQELANWFTMSTSAPRMVSLESLGVRVGQGLRTGANAFFYANVLTESEGMVTLATEGYKAVAAVNVPSICALPVLRRQNELPNGYVLRAADLKGRVLALQDMALSEDIKAGGKSARLAYSTIPKGLASYIRWVATKNFGTPNEPKRIYELSAVAPNIRRAYPSKSMPPRFWYMLPNFAFRHRPSLLMARINNASPKTFLNEKCAALVDANFSTIWLDDETTVNSHSLLALLNSSWCRAVLELSAAVMGGGALKVEAAHIRRLPIPSMNINAWIKLSELGQQLTANRSGEITNQVIWEIDFLITSSLLGREATKEDITQIQNILEAGATRRGLHKTNGKSKF